MTAKHFFTKNCIIFLSIVVVILLYPFLFLAILVLYIYRCFVKYIVSTDPKAGNILTGMDAIFASKDAYIKPLASIYPFLTFSSKVEKSEVIRIFTERILKPKDNNGGKCVYPELMQKLVRKYGYWFWWENDNFQLEDHIKYINEEDPEIPMTREDVNDFMIQKLTKRSYDPGRSPWEILIVRNLIDTEASSGIVFNLHHCLFDGHSFVNLIKRLSLNSWNKEERIPEVKSSTFWQKVIRIVFEFLGPAYLLVKFTLLQSDNNVWNRVNFKHFNGDEWNGNETVAFSMTTLKNIKDHFKVTLSSILFTVVAEGFRRHMESKAVSLSKIHLNFPMYLPGHPDRLTNHISGGKIPVIFAITGTGQTLHNVDNEYRRHQAPWVSLTNWRTSKFAGLLPIPLHPNPNSVRNTSLLVSNFPLSGHKIDVFGYEVVSVTSCGKPVPSVGIVAQAVGYNGFLRINFRGVTCLVPGNEDAVALGRTLEDVMHELAIEANA